MNDFVCVKFWSELLGIVLSCSLCIDAARFWFSGTILQRCGE